MQSCCCFVLSLARTGTRSCMTAWYLHDSHRDIAVSLSVLSQLTLRHTCLSVSHLCTHTETQLSVYLSSVNSHWNTVDSLSVLSLLTLRHCCLLFVLCQLTLRHSCLSVSPLSTHTETLLSLCLSSVNSHWDRPVSVSVLSQLTLRHSVSLSVLYHLSCRHTGSLRLAHVAIRVLHEYKLSHPSYLSPQTIFPSHHIPARLIHVAHFTLHVPCSI